LAEAELADSGQISNDDAVVDGECSTALVESRATLYRHTDVVAALKPGRTPTERKRLSRPRW
jgi:hypothetical protein